ncbi:aquaporin-10-like [Dysidea avara]|uniref:aquaporin-10-like n=1 Tax=Dysidea avara TaxID=196820 RepID=UPI0033316A25
MSSDSDYLLEQIASTNASKEPTNSSLLIKIRELWKQAIYYAGKDYIAEFLATFVLMIFGTGSVAQVLLSQNKFGDWLSINLSWGFGVTFGCYMAMGISGAHMNPAVTLAMVVLRRLSWKKIIGYWIAQYLAAFLSSAIVFGIYYDALERFENFTDTGHRSIATAGIWATYPQEFVSNVTGFFDQVLGTFLLVLGVVAICDGCNTEPKHGLKPFMIGLLVVAIGATYGYNCGYAINPARDFSPRLFTFCAGWGTQVFTHHNYWFWIPIVAPSIGGILGGLTYVLLIELHHTQNY